MASSTTARPGAVIKVIGVGGGGSNAVNRMVAGGVEGVEFLVVNTDAQALMQSSAHKTIQIGENVTRGLGAGGNPEVGRAAAEESRQEVKNALEGADMIFIAAGMGGGTGTGAAPVIAEVCRELEALTVAVVTKPFSWEGAKRLRVAEEGVRCLKERVDTMITIPNDRLVNVAKLATLLEAFEIADDVLHHGVKGISEIITVPGLINVDFADVRAVMQDAGSALMGIGTASGEGRAAAAAQAAIASPLLETTIDGARGVLMNITAGPDFKLDELLVAAQTVSQSTDDENLNLILGHALNPDMKDEVRITVLATGFEPPRMVREPERRIGLQTERRAETSRLLEPDRERTGAQLGQDAEPTRPARGKGPDWDFPTFLKDRWGSGNE